MEYLKKIESILNYIFQIICKFTGSNKRDDEKEILDKKFNDDLENGKSTQYCDALRKQKQKEVERIKNA